jgi:hypothetical protein
MAYIIRILVGCVYVVRKENVLLGNIKIGNVVVGR